MYLYVWGVIYSTVCKCISAVAVHWTGREQIPECATDALDPEIRLQIAHMCSLKPEQVELKRLKYLEKQAKYTLKVAECKANLSGLKNDSNGEKDLPGTTLKEKVGKYRGQIAETDVRLACTQRLVDVAEMFIAQGKDAQVLVRVCIIYACDGENTLLTCKSVLCATMWWRSSVSTR